MTPRWFLRAIAIAAAGCAPHGVADVTPARAPVSTTTTTSATVATNATNATNITEWRVLARVTSDAIASDEARVYFGDDAAGVFYGSPKQGEPSPLVIGRPAPIAIALGPASIVWVGAPGNAVLRVPREGGPVELLREGSGFTAVATSGPDVFVAQARSPDGGTLTRITDRKATVVARFGALPRALAIDEQNVYVQTPRELVRLSRTSGVTATLAAGESLSRLTSDDVALYTTEIDGPSRAVVRVPKAGGTPSILEQGVRDAPIGVDDGWVYYLEESDQPALRRVAKTGGGSALVARADELRRVRAMAIDASGIYVASDRPSGGSVIAMPVSATPPVAMAAMARPPRARAFGAKEGGKTP